MEEVNTVHTMTPPEPLGGLAAEHAADATLRSAVAKNRARGSGHAPVPIVEALERLRVNQPPRRNDADVPLEQVTASVRIPEAEGDQFARTSATVRDLLPRLIPARFETASFDTYAPQTASQRTARTVVRRWVESALAGEGPMLALVGETGAGKSHLLYAAAREIIAHNVRVYARPWYLLAHELRYGGESPFMPAGRTNLLEPYDVRTLLYRERVLLIDEVRPTAATAFDDTELAKLACHAYDSRRAVLITTNWSPLEQVMGAPATSRFQQITVVGPDGRQS